MPPTVGPSVTVYSHLGPLSLFQWFVSPFRPADWDIWWRLSPRRRPHLSAEVRALGGERLKGRCDFPGEPAPWWVPLIGPIPTLS